jgi:hypothetical protein
MPKLSIAQMAAELALKSKPKKTIQGVERQANLNKFLEGSKIKERLYHGTKSNLNQFQPNSFFTPSPEGASTYAMGEGANVTPTYINLKNPATKKQIEQVAKKLGIYHPDKETWEYISPNHPETGEESALVLNELKKRGHDGVNIEDYDANDTDPWSRERIESYQVFDPRNVKSAIGNEGTFNPNEVDITKASGGVIKKAISTARKLPPPENAQRTQIIGTLPTYEKARQIFELNKRMSPFLPTALIQSILNDSSLGFSSIL